MSTDPQTEQRCICTGTSAGLNACAECPTPWPDIPGATRIRREMPQPAAAPAAVPPTGQAGLREPIAAALYRHEWPGKQVWEQALAMDREAFLAQADAVLSVLVGPIPAGTDTATWTAIRAIQLMNEAGKERDVALAAPVDRSAAVWLDAAAECNKAGGAHAGRGDTSAASAAFALMEKFLMEAGKADYVATPCSAPDHCEDGGEPCSVHERLMGHVEGDHELCVPDCGSEWLRRMAAETPPAPPGCWYDAEAAEEAMRAESMAAETPGPETQAGERATWTPGPVALARSAAWASQQRAATVDPAMCPRCKGDNSEAFELCARCATAPAVVAEPGKENSRG